MTERRNTQNSIKKMEIIVIVTEKYHKIWWCQKKLYLCKSKGCVPQIQPCMCVSTRSGFAGGASSALLHNTVALPIPNAGYILLLFPYLVRIDP